MQRTRAEAALRAVGLSYPETHEDFPWPGHCALKVRGKVFAILSNGEPGLSVSLKLPWSAEGALQFPFCEPTGYGLGRSGWITATFGRRDTPPMDILRSWLDESYRAVAPKRLVATLGASEKVAFPSLTRRRTTERRKKVGTARRRA